MSYFGGKGGPGVFQTIINEIPRHDLFVSAFAGHCSVLANPRLEAKRRFDIGENIERRSSPPSATFRAIGKVESRVENFYAGFEGET